MMTEENKNIDKFFADRLTNKQTPEDDWNTPSDDIWLSAKEHFPKKKPRRRFIFWLFGIALMASSIYTLYTVSDKTTTPQQATNNLSINDPSDGVEKISRNNTPQGADAIAIPSTTDSDTPTNTSHAIDEKTNDQPSASVNTSENTEVKVSNSTKETTRETNKIVTKVKEESSQENHPNAVAITAATTVNNESSEEVTITNITNTTNSTAQITTPTLIDAGVPVEPQSRGLLTLARLQSMVSGVTPTSTPIKFDKGITPMAKILAPMPLSEIGISHSEFLLGLLLHVVVYSVEDGSASNIDFSINSLNLSRRNWLGKNISVSYGVNTTLLKMNADIDIIDTLQKDISAFISDEYNSRARRNLNPDNLDVQLKDGFELLEGDIVTVMGNVTLDVLAVQFPVMLDYHFYRNKWEYLIGTGASLDLLWHNQEEIDISLFKAGQKVNKPLIIEGSRDFDVDYSIYSALGVRYHLSDSWNIGITTKIDVLEPIFSHMQFGIYHRWNK